MSILYQNEQRDFPGFRYIAGVDEAGRGPLAGPLVAAACILGQSPVIEMLNDSKKLTEKKREEVYCQIIANALAYQIVIVPVPEIDRRNILGATLYGMEEAVKRLSIKPEVIIIDGISKPAGLPEAFTIIKGDGLYASIAAASILAKVTRDRIMRELHQHYPYYNFFQNKGYPTREHIKALGEHGITEHHRKSYHPVKHILNISRIRAETEDQYLEI